MLSFAWSLMTLSSRGGPAPSPSLPPPRDVGPWSRAAVRTAMQAGDVTALMQELLLQLSPSSLSAPPQKRTQHAASPRGALSEFVHAALLMSTTNEGSLPWVVGGSTNAAQPHILAAVGDVLRCLARLHPESLPVTTFVSLLTLLVAATCGESVGDIGGSGSQSSAFLFRLQRQRSVLQSLFTHLSIAAPSLLGSTARAAVDKADRIEHNEILRRRQFEASWSAWVGWSRNPDPSGTAPVTTLEDGLATTESILCIPITALISFAVSLHCETFPEPLVAAEEEEEEERHHRRQRVLLKVLLEQLDPQDGRCDAFLTTLRDAMDHFASETLPPNSFPAKLIARFVPTICHSIRMVNSMQTSLESLELEVRQLANDDDEDSSSNAAAFSRDEGMPNDTTRMRHTVARLVLFQQALLKAWLLVLQIGAGQFYAADHALILETAIEVAERESWRSRSSSHRPASTTIPSVTTTRLWRSDGSPTTHLATATQSITETGSRYRAVLNGVASDSVDTALTAIQTVKHFLDKGLVLPTQQLCLRLAGVIEGCDNDGDGALENPAQHRDTLQRFRYQQWFRGLERGYLLPCAVVSLLTSLARQSRKGSLWETTMHCASWVVAHVLPSDAFFRELKGDSSRPLSPSSIVSHLVEVDGLVSLLQQLIWVVEGASDAGSLVRGDDLASLMARVADAVAVLSDHVVGMHVYNHAKDQDGSYHGLWFGVPRLQELWSFLPADVYRAMQHVLGVRSTESSHNLLTAFQPDEVVQIRSVAASTESAIAQSAKRILQIGFWPLVKSLHQCVQTLQQRADRGLLPEWNPNNAQGTSRSPVAPQQVSMLLVMLSAVAEPHRQGQGDLEVSIPRLLEGFLSRMYRSVLRIGLVATKSDSSLSYDEEVVLGLELCVWLPFLAETVLPFLLHRTSSLLFQPLPPNLRQSESPSTVATGGIIAMEDERLQHSVTEVVLRSVTTLVRSSTVTSRFGQRGPLETVADVLQTTPGPWARLLWQRGGFADQPDSLRAALHTTLAQDTLRLLVVRPWFVALTRWFQSEPPSSSSSASLRAQCHYLSTLSVDQLRTLAVAHSSAPLLLREAPAGVTSWLLSWVVQVETALTLDLTAQSQRALTELFADSQVRLHLSRRMEIALIAAATRRERHQLRALLYGLIARRSPLTSSRSARGILAVIASFLVEGVQPRSSSPTTLPTPSTLQVEGAAPTSLLLPDWAASGGTILESVQRHW